MNKNVQLILLLALGLLVAFLFWYRLPIPTALDHDIAEKYLKKLQGELESYERETKKTYAFSFRAKPNFIQVFVGGPTEEEEFLRVENAARKARAVAPGVSVRLTFLNSPDDGNSILKDVPLNR